jgi:heterodisulfide reductase subunit A-like polyferredoxin
MFFAASEIYPQRLLHPENKEEDPTGDLEACHVQAENRKDEGIEEKKEVHEPAGDCNSNECLTVDLPRCLAFCHCGKNRDTEQGIKYDKERSERVKDIGKEFLHNLS